MNLIKVINQKKYHEAVKFVCFLKSEFTLRAATVLALIAISLMGCGNGFNLQQSSTPLSEDNNFEEKIKRLPEQVPFYKTSTPLPSAGNTSDRPQDLGANSDDNSDDKRKSNDVDIPSPKKSNELLPENKQNKTQWRVLSPTVYYLPKYKDSAESCKPATKKNIKDKSGKILAKVCPKVYSSCAMQGSCLVMFNDQGQSIERLFNVANVIKNETRFFELDRQICPYGMGVKNQCLVPFYSVAADLRYHKIGDIIFVPGIVGLRLPGGEVHNGYLEVSDIGRRIIGKDRFDFFSGEWDLKNVDNSFIRAGLADKKANHILYSKIKVKE